MVLISRHQRSGIPSLCRSVTFGGLPQVDVTNMDDIALYEESIAQGERFYLKKAKKGIIFSGQTAAESFDQDEESVSNSLWTRNVEPQDFCQKVPSRYRNHDWFWLQWLGHIDGFFAHGWAAASGKVPDWERSQNQTDAAVAIWRWRCLLHFGQKARHWLWCDDARGWLLGVSGHLHCWSALSAVQRGRSSAWLEGWARDRSTTGSPDHRDNEAFQLCVGKCEASRHSQEVSPHTSSSCWTSCGPWQTPAFDGRPMLLNSFKMLVKEQQPLRV